MISGIYKCNYHANTLMKIRNRPENVIPLCQNDSQFSSTNGISYTASILKG